MSQRSFAPLKTTVYDLTCLELKSVLSMQPTTFLTPTSFRRRTGAFS